MYKKPIHAGAFILSLFGLSACAVSSNVSDAAPNPTRSIHGCPAINDVKADNFPSWRLLGVPQHLNLVTDWIEVNIVVNSNNTISIYCDYEYETDDRIDILIIYKNANVDVSRLPDTAGRALDNDWYLRADTIERTWHCTESIDGCKWYEVAP